MTDEELAVIKEREDAATPGPWVVGGMGDTVESIAKQENGCTIEGWFVADMVGEDDAAFIAHAREDIPALIAEVERLRAQNNALGYGLLVRGRWVRVPM